MEFRKKLRNFILREEFDSGGWTEKLLDTLWDVETLDGMCGEELSRSGVVGLQLIWQELHLMDSGILDLPGSENLKGVAEKIDKTWALPDSQAEIYGAVREKIAPLDPFSSENTMKFCAELLDLGRLEAAWTLSVSDVHVREQRFLVYNLSSLGMTSPTDETLECIRKLKEDLKQPRLGQELESDSRDWHQIIDNMGYGCAATQLFSLPWDSENGAELEKFCLRRSAEFPTALVLWKELSWKRMRKLFQWLLWLNGASFPPSLDDRTGYRFRNIHLSCESVLSQSGIWLMDAGGSGHLSLSQAEKLRKEVREACGALWKQGIHLGLLGTKIKEGLAAAKLEVIETLTAALSNMASLPTKLASKMDALLASDRDSDLFLLKAGLFMCEVSLPPKGFLDPVEKNAAQKRILELQEEEVECEVRVIKRFHHLLTGVETFCREGASHPHPYISALLRRREAVRQKLEAVNRHTVHVRPAGQTLEQLGMELNGFFQLTDAAMSGVSQVSGTEELSVLAQNLSKLQGWLASAERFNRILLTDFTGFPDVWSPFLIGLMLCQASANLVSAKCARGIQRMSTGKGSMSREQIVDLMGRAFQLYSECDKTDGRNQSISQESWLLPESILPTRLQLLHFLNSCSPNSSIGRSTRLVLWLIRQWKCLKEMEKVTGEEENRIRYEYRQRKRDREEDSLEDSDMKELQKRFPDFSSDKEWMLESEPLLIEETSEDDKGTNTRRHDLVSAVRSLMSSCGIGTKASKVSGRRKDLNSDHEYSTALWLLKHGKICACDIPEDPSSPGVHLLEFSELRESLVVEEERDSEMNVYKDSSVSALRRCWGLVSELRNATQRLKSEWGDVAALDQIQVTTDRILRVPMDSPLMKLAVCLEGLLENCEQWEMVASKAVSLESWLEPLRGLLIEWRKMEVMSWERILGDLERERADEALLAGLDLLDACLQVNSGDVNKEVAIGMGIEWMKCSELGDFTARLDVLEMCREFVTGDLKGHLDSFLGFYRLYQDRVAMHLEAQRKNIETELKNFVKIIKFQDLNIWTVKQSVQKAHRQLFSYVKKYQQEVLSESFLPQIRCPLSIDGGLKACDHETSSDQNLPKDEWISEEETGRDLSGIGCSAMKDSDSRIIQKRGEEFVGSLDPLLAWSEGIRECGQLLDTSRAHLKVPLSYSEKSKEEKQKTMKRTLVSRKLELTEALNSVRDLGFHARKGLNVDSDRLGYQLLFGIPGSESGDRDLMDAMSAIRMSGTWRQAFLEASEKPNLQIGPQLCGKFRGLAELIPDVMCARVSEIYGFHGEKKAMEDVTECLGAAALDLAEREALPNQNIVDENFRNIGQQLESIASLLTETQKVWSCCPERGAGEEWDVECLKDKSPLLAGFIRDDGKYVEVMNGLNSSMITVSELRCSFSALSPGKYVKMKDVSRMIEELSRLNSVKDSVGSLLEVSRCNSSPSFFDSGLIRVAEIIESTKENLQKLTECVQHVPEPFSTDFERVCEDGMRELKLGIQRCWKEVATADSVEGTPSCLTLLSKLLFELRLWKIKERSRAVLNELRKGLESCQTGRLASFVDAAKTVLGITEMLLKRVLGDLRNLSCVYAYLMDMFIKLVKEGFVEPVPEEIDGGDTCGATKFEDKEDAGLGEGEGAKDVTEEIEDTSQIEDSKTPGEETEKEEEDRQEKMEDVHAPIEMDQDFDAQLEDMNLDDDDSDESEDEKEGEDGEDEVQPDWNMGEAEEPEEEQLDPSLWDEEKEDTLDPPLDDSNKGGDTELTEDLAAKEEDHLPPQETEGKEGEDEGEDEEDDEGDHEMDLENMDLRDTLDQEEEETEKDGEETQDNRNDGDAGAEEDEEKNEEIRVEDMSEMNAASESQSGAGRAEEEAESIAGGENSKEDHEDEKKVEQEEKEKNENDGTADNSSSGKLDDNFKYSERNMKEDGLEPSGKRKKRKRDTTLGDPDKEWSKDRKIRETEMGEGSGKPESDSTAERSSGLWSHAPDLKVSESQALDSASLEEAQKQKLGDITPEEEEVSREMKDHKEDGERNGAESKTGHDLEGEMVEETMEGAGDDIEGDEDRKDRPRDSTIHTVLDFYTHVRESLKLEDWNVRGGSSCGDEMWKEGYSGPLWAKLQNLVHPLAAELSENLRLTLEPTQASKMEGDFRSGKRLNIRKLIPYVASNYRKDKIWLRRTKRAKRNYQVLIAVDDSSSMQDNKTRQLAYECVTLLGVSLRYLEVGQVGICKFGVEPEVLCPMTSHFSDEDGASVIGRLRFDQQKTNINKLLEFSARWLDGWGGGEGVPSQLLIIVSDGRGLFVDGMEKVRRAVQTTLAANIFIVFVILDSPEHKDSILDIKVPVFGKSGYPPLIRSYMDFFPFPFYVILRELSALPAVVGDALRQWFEIVSDKS